MSAPRPVTDPLQFVSYAPAWLIQADHLKRAADLVGSQFQNEANTWALAEGFAQDLDDDPEAWSRRMHAWGLALPAYMLVGYAIEVLLKGLIAVRDSSPEAVKWMTHEHLGMALVERARVTLVSNEQFLVENQLYHAVRWSGRYPAPNDRDALRFERQIAAAGGVIFSDPRAVSPDHYRQARELYDRLEQELMEEIAAARRERLAGPSGPV